MKNKLNLLQKFGFLLILLSLCLLVGRELLGAYSRRQTEMITDQIEAILTEQIAGSPEDYTDPNMPVLQLDGRDFSGLIRIPAFGVHLPIGNDWDADPFSIYPRRFWGSVYDNSLILGGSDRKGQFDFCNRIDIGDKILITDLTGAQFSYEVARIERHSHADTQALLESSWDLTLFVRDSSSLDYIFVRCMFSP